MKAALDLSQENARRAKATLWIDAGILTGMAVLVLAVLWCLQHRVTGPLQGITPAVTQLSKGNFDTEIR